jgi:hypothetical protein
MVDRGNALCLCGALRLSRLSMGTRTAPTSGPAKEIRAVETLGGDGSHVTFGDRPDAPSPSVSPNAVGPWVGLTAPYRRCRDHDFAYRVRPLANREDRFVEPPV